MYNQIISEANLDQFNRISLKNLGYFVSFKNCVMQP